MSQATQLAVVILAAGQGTRMHSTLPKVLHAVAGQPMITYAVRAAQALSAAKPVVVVGYGQDLVQKTVGKRAAYALQKQQLGTAHALMAAQDLLEGTCNRVLVCYGDMPLLCPETLQRLVAVHDTGPGPLSMLTVVSDDPRGFGRVLRDADGQVSAIVEEKDATPEQLAVPELNAGVYCFDAAWLWEHLHRITPSPRTREYYLTDLVALAAGEGHRIATESVGDVEELLGINTRVHLAEAEVALRRRVATAWMLAGVTIVDPATAYLDADVAIGRDTIIYPNTHVLSGAQVGESCLLGPNSVIRGGRLGAGCIVESSTVDYKNLKAGVRVGPYEYLSGKRKDAPDT